MNIYIQYAFTGIVLVLAVWYIVRLFKDTFLSKKKDGCGGTDCKCGRK